MTQRDRLIELLKNKYDHFCDQCGVNKDSHYIENLADYLLANGEKVFGLPLEELNELVTAKKENRLIVPPCKVGDTVYKICPKCNPTHNGSCRSCAWAGCMVACDIGVGICSDGSYNEHDLQIVPIRVNKSNIITIMELWNIQFYLTEKDAIISMIEYDDIRKTEDKQERYTKYNDWEAKRKTHYSFLEKNTCRNEG